MNFSIFNEMKPLKALETAAFPEASLEVTLIIPARNASHALESTVVEAHRFLSHRYPDSFEIILVPNPLPDDGNDRSLEVADALARRFPQVQVCPHSTPKGKGAAIRTGLLASRGRWIFFTDADLPYDLDFFDAAASCLRQGFDLVSGNRRLPTSHFNIPVDLLPVAYGRHRLGLAFNRVVRWLLPIATTDTQAGIKALSRRLALEAFSRQSCPGFLFDLEVFLTADGHGYWQTQLPVTLYLKSEKSTVRVLRESVLVAYWLSRLAFRNFRKAYGDHGRRNRRVTNRYHQAPWMTRLFLYARWKLTPYSRMAAHLPAQGRILDLGCGHGLLALIAALGAPSREILGIDHDPKRIELGTHAVRDVPNLRLEHRSMVHTSLQSASPSEPFSGIAMIDVMHYFDPQTQETLVKQAFDGLEKGGTLLVREVDPQGGMISSWNRLYEKWATRMGFTQAEKKGLYFRSRQGWEDLFRTGGFRVSSERCSSVLFADILFICERL